MAGAQTLFQRWAAARFTMYHEPCREKVTVSSATSMTATPWGMEGQAQAPCFPSVRSSPPVPFSKRGGKTMGA